MKLLWTVITAQGRDKLAGYLAGDEDPLFIICVDVHETTSYHLTGAFVPTRDERELRYASADQAKAAAAIYLSAWMLRRQDEFMAGLGKEAA